MEHYKVKAYFVGYSVKDKKAGGQYADQTYLVGNQTWTFFADLKIAQEAKSTMQKALKEGELTFGVRSGKYNRPEVVFVSFV